MEFVILWSSCGDPVELLWRLCGVCNPVKLLWGSCGPQSILWCAGDFGFSVEVAPYFSIFILYFYIY